MRRIIYWFGIFAACAAVFGFFGFCYMAYKGFVLDKEAKAYAQSSVDAITSRWNSRALLDRASPNLLKSVNPEQIASLFQWFGVLGPLASSQECEGTSRMSVSTNQPKRTTAEYVCHERYLQGSASIQLSLIKLDTGWMINGFHVNSPALLPRTSGPKPGQPRSGEL